jgi:probable rRNA maturation factor
MSSIAVHDRQRGIKIDRGKLQDFAERALQLLRKPDAGEKHGKKLPNVDVIVVSDRRISELHRRFLHLDGPTDVITFQHGEIFISVETARRQADAYGVSLRHELQLYLVHGLLHLLGFDDKDPAGARKMRAMQKKISRDASKSPCRTGR